MNRRHFLRLLGSTAVASGVAASAGFDLSHFLSWLTRNPRWSFPTDVHPLYTPATQIIPADEMFPEIEPLMTIYYDRKAIELLKANLILGSATWKIHWDEGEAQRFGNVYKPVLKTQHGLVVV